MFIFKAFFIPPQQRGDLNPLLYPVFHIPLKLGMKQSHKCFRSSSSFNPGATKPLENALVGSRVQFVPCFKETRAAGMNIPVPSNSVKPCCYPRETFPLFSSGAGKLSLEKAPSSRCPSESEGL